jgi:hypothetical protein
VTPEFATNFKFAKSKGRGEFGIKYMEAGFNKEAESGEFFLEFEDYIWEHKLVESFQLQGAGQVNTITFAHNDGGDSASNALLRILASQEKTGITYSRGTCPPALLAKVQAKQAAARAAAVSTSKEFDEKTLAVIKQSLEDNKEAMIKVENGMQSQVVKLDGIENGMQSQVVKLDGIENGMQSQVVKLDGIENGMQSQVVKLDGIQDGVCNVIPDYQREIVKLREALAHKTKLCDRIEGQKGRLTMEINKLKWELGEKSDANEALNRDKFITGKKMQDLQMQLDMCQSIALLKQMQEETQRTAEILSSTLADERAAKRQRGV